MKLFTWFKSLFSQTSPAVATPTTPATEMAERLTRLERNYLVLLKRLLEIDGVKLKVATSKTQVFNNKVLTTPDDKGLNDSKPTIH